MSNHNKNRQAKSNPAQAPASTTKNIQTQDSFSNLIARLGNNQGDGNQMAASTYALGPFLSRNRLQLEAMYRSSWLVGQVVDTVAEDMTREGISMYSEMKPEDIKKLQIAISEFAIWQDICSTIKWGRLYGGAIAVILIDGADYAKELDIEKVRKGQFKGLVVLDRWQIQPAMGELITDLCKDIGKPKYYEVLSGVSTFPSAKIHYSRVIRFEGIELPYYQRLFENLWGLSVIERMYDRLVAFDSATQGAAQLLFRAHLRVIGIKGFRQALAEGGADENAVIKQFQYIRAMQTNEGITVLDAEDQFNVHTYRLNGIAEVLNEFGQQISGCVQIPLVRLFGQSPAGLSATGESDLRNYYDHINKEQNSKIKPQLDKLLAVMAKSVLGYDLPEDFTCDFNSLWQLSDTEKAQIASTDVQTQSSAMMAGITTKAMALKELKQQSEVSGRFTNITADDIKDAENEPPPGFGGLEDFDLGDGSQSKSGEQIENDDPNERLGGQDPTLPDEEKEKPGIETMPDATKDCMDSATKKKVRFNDSARAILRKLLRNKLRYKSLPQPLPDSKQDDITITDNPIPVSKLPVNETGLVYKGYVMKQEDSGRIVIYAAGGSQIGDCPSLELAMNKINGIAIEVGDADFKESEHPRGQPDNSGQFVEGGGKQQTEKKKPATEITHEDLDENAKKKYQRITSLQKQFDSIWKENNLIIDKDEKAACLALIMKTGIRPGSDTDTHAKKKAYGATTLEGRHVIQKDGKVSLQYVGKKGVDLNISVNDPELAKMLIERKNKVGDNGRIFRTTDKKLLEYSHSLDGGEFKTKDFRTHIGTTTAIAIIKKESPPKDFKEYKSKVMQVAKQVCIKLGNTPIVCLQAYIDPRVFSSWREGIKA